MFKLEFDEGWRGKEEQVVVTSWLRARPQLFSLRTSRYLPLLQHSSSTSINGIDINQGLARLRVLGTF